MGLSDDQLATINDMVLGVTIVSFFGSCFIIGSLGYFWYVKHEDKLNKYVYKLIFNVGFSDFLYEISFWFANEDTSTESAACEFSGFLQQVGTMSSVLWVTLIAYSIYSVSTNPTTNLEERLIYFYGGIWSYSFFTALLPLTTDSYGQAGGWCWIESGNAADLVWRFLIFYFPVWAAIFFICYMYYRVYAIHGEFSPIMQQMGLYPAILVCTWTFGTINRIVQAGGKDVYGLILVHAFLMSLYGLLNCLAYVYTPKVREVVFGCEQQTSGATRSSSPSPRSGKTDIELRAFDDVEASESDLGKNTSSFNVDLQVTEPTFGSSNNSMDVVYANTESDMNNVTGSNHAVEVSVEQDDFPMKKSSEHI